MRKCEILSLGAASGQQTDYGNCVPLLLCKCVEPVVWPMLVTNQNEMRTIQVGITMLKDRESAVFGPVMAGVIIALLPTVLLFVLFQRKIVSGMMSGAVKE